MHVQMINRLATVATAIQDRAKTIGEVQFNRQFSRDDQQVAQQGLIFNSRVCQGRDRLPRNDQHVGGGLGIDIPKRQALRIFVNDVCGDLAINDFLKDCHRSDAWHW
jgi:hypothetical protein